MDVIIVQGDIARFSADAIVNAASTSLEMGGGVAAAIRKIGGKEIEDEVLESAPLELGQAIATAAGKLDAKFVIHAASMKLGEKATAENIRLAFRNSLDLANALECQSIAVPAIGCGMGGFSLEEGAQILLMETKQFQPTFLQTIFFVLFSQEAHNVFVRKAQELGLSLTLLEEYKKRVREEEAQRAREREQRESESETAESGGEANEKQEETQSPAEKP